MVLEEGVLIVVCVVFFFVCFFFLPDLECEAECVGFSGGSNAATESC